MGTFVSLRVRETVLSGDRQCYYVVCLRRPADQRLTKTYREDFDLEVFLDLEFFFQSYCFENLYCDHLPRR